MVSTLPMRLCAAAVAVSAVGADLTERLQMASPPKLTWQATAAHTGYSTTPEQDCKSADHTMSEWTYTINNVTGSCAFPYLSNGFNLTAEKPTYEKLGLLVIAMPEEGAQAQQSFCAVSNVVAKVKGYPEGVVGVITPWFKGSKDAGDYVKWDPTLAPPHGAWWSGYNASAKAGLCKPDGEYTTVSSFDMVDQLITMATNKTVLPNLKTLVLIGHSNGAQAIQRYTMTSSAYSLAASGLDHVRAVIANPTSYCYPEEAWEGKAGAKCPVYDQWDLGLKTLPVFVNETVNEVNKTGELLKTVMAYNTTYLVGQYDNCTRKLDKGCSAFTPPTGSNACGVMLQGDSRLARGNNYTNWLLKTAKAKKYPVKHAFLQVPRVGHEGAAMIQSTEAVKLIFDTTPPPSPSPSPHPSPPPSPSPSPHPSPPPSPSPSPHPSPPPSPSPSPHPHPSPPPSPHPSPPPTPTPNTTTGAPNSAAFDATVEDSFWIVGIASVVFVFAVICVGGAPKIVAKVTGDAGKDPVYSGF